MPRRRFDLRREERAEAKAAELLRSVVSAEDWAMYSALGFLRVRGRGFAYLLYPHRPLIAYEEGSGQVLTEYCVRFPDDDEILPASDDVLAKWMALKGDERALITDANVLPAGRQVDPGQVQRDLARLREWDRGRGSNNLSP